MKRTEVPGGFLITHTPEEIRQINKNTKISIELGLKAQEILYKSKNAVISEKSDATVPPARPS